MSAIVICRGKAMVSSKLILLHERGTDIAAGLNQEEVVCVSLGTGTKCLSTKVLPNCRGSIVHDCHAEVLALRGFNHWVLKEISYSLKDSSFRSRYLVKTCGVQAGLKDTLFHHPYAFRFADDISIHLFTTEAPCGDASMELLIASKSVQDAVPWSVDTKELIDGPVLLGRGHFSVFGMVRRKPARADAEPSLSKSCTDKIAVKQFTGLLSFPADVFVATSASSFLSSMVVYKHQFHHTGYERAFGPDGRLAAVSGQNAHFFKVQVLPSNFKTFSFEKSREQRDAQVHKQKASNISAVWILGQDTQHDRDVVEVLISGVKQGYKLYDERQGKESVLCRRRLWHTGRDICTLIHRDSITDSRPVHTLPHCCDLQASLRSSAYCSAKKSTVRYEKIKIRTDTVTQMGNWIKNKGDDEWSLS